MAFKATLYDRLGLIPSASKKEIVENALLLAFRYKPQEGRFYDTSNLYNEIKEAELILCDDEKRNIYDQSLEAVRNDLASVLSLKDNNNIARDRYRKRVKAALDETRKLIEGAKVGKGEDIQLQNNPIKEDIGSRYDALLQKYSSGSDRDKLDNIKITSDGKVEMMGRKFSLLQPKDGKEDRENGIVRGDATKGMGNVRYFSGTAAEAECARQGNGMRLFDTKEEIDQFIEQFPGTNTSEKILNCAALFGLEKGGLWNPNKNQFSEVGIGFVLLSKIGDYIRGEKDKELVYCFIWNKNNGDTRLNPISQKVGQSVIVSENF